MSARVYEQLKALVGNGEFPDNAKLPTEMALSKQFGVSRPVVREALERLRDEGIIYSRRGSGSYVMPKPAAKLHFTPITSIADVEKCFEFRAEIEGSVARLAALHRDQEDLREIEAALEALEKSIEATGRLEGTADGRFHLAICKATKNSFFILLCESIRSHIEFSINLGEELSRNLSLMRPAERLRRIQRLKLIYAEHVAIYEAIRDRDPQRAQAAAVVHINNARRRVFQGAEKK
ncbi:MAG: FadR family transcriptional regulator [Pseudomonadota bacterium]|nr:FadR family transcriptional regulator [Pseudomonadota bacterium]